VRNEQRDCRKTLKKKNTFKSGKQKYKRIKRQRIIAGNTEKALRSMDGGVTNPYLLDQHGQKT